MFYGTFVGSSKNQGFVRGPAVGEEGKESGGLMQEIQLQGHGLYRKIQNISCIFALSINMKLQKLAGCATAKELIPYSDNFFKNHNFSNVLH